MASDARMVAPACASSHRPWLARLVGAQTAVQTHRALWGYLFVLPWVLGLIFFFGGPILASLYFGFTEYSILSPPPVHRAGEL
ncbi:MAG: hypothetical protein K6U78_01240 [Anaerolineae bacterium]|nr:hypothetical protein [Anaerolineae bacterium]